MSDKFTEQFAEHIDFSYTSFDRVILRGYITNLFVEGSVIKLLRNLGFNNHSNGVLKLFTAQLNSHIIKVAKNLAVDIHWWGKEEKAKYHSKVDFIKDKYQTTLKQKHQSSKVIGIIKSVEKTRTFANKEVTTQSGKNHTKMYSCNKLVSHYYFYIYDQTLGLCYLKMSGYLPFPCEFYFNGHNYLKQQFDKQGQTYTMEDNSFIKLGNLQMLEELVSNFQPSTALSRIDYWMNIFFRFDKGTRSTCSKLLTHNWYTGQTEISTNIIFKSPKFAASLFQRILNKHHTIGLPDKLTEVFSLKKNPHNSKTTQNKYGVQACIKHWLEGNSIKCYNKSGCLLRVETTINKPELPGLKLKKPACNLQAYYWYGHACNSRYLTTLADIDINSLRTEDFEKYQQAIINAKGRRIAAPDLRKEEQLELYAILLSANYFTNGFRNKDLQKLLGGNWKTAKIAYELKKLREREAIKKIKNSHYYRVTEEGMNWLFYALFNLLYFVNPLLSMQIKNKQKNMANNPSAFEQAYSIINEHKHIIMNELGIAA